MLKVQHSMPKDIYDPRLPQLTMCCSCDQVARRKFRVWLQFVANSRRTRSVDSFVHICARLMLNRALTDRALKRASATSTISAASATSSQEADAKRAMVVSPTPSVRCQLIISAC